MHDIDKKYDVVLEDVPCCTGCMKNDEVIFSAYDLLHNLPGEYAVVKCLSCSLMRTNPRPTPETIGFYYPDDYGPYLGSRVPLVKDESPSVIKRWLKPLVNRIFEFNGMVLPPLPPARMLEIGCASGSYLHQMAEKGWQVQGIEFSGKAAKAAQTLGYAVYVGPLETAPQPEHSVDLIVGWMVLEHLYDPVAGLRKLRKWAKPAAWLALSVPNAGSLEFHLFKNKWYALQVPTHLHHFTPRSLEKVLLVGGWSLVKVHHQRSLSNAIDSLGYLLREKGYTKLGKKLIDFPEKGGRFVYALYPLSWLLSLFGQTGRMTIWAKKT